MRLEPEEDRRSRRREDDYGTSKESPRVDRVTMSGGYVLARMLKAHGVRVLFGMGGFQLLPFYDAIYQLGMSHHLVNDERAGIFAADAYSRVSGTPGVCDGTQGPGATNLVTGLVESLNAGVPLVVLVGDTHRSHSGKNMTQEGRQVEILRPAAKEVIRVEQVERLPELVRRAFAVATSGRPGPVVIDVPEDVAHAETTMDAADLRADPRSVAAPAHRPRPDVLGILAAADLLRTAQRPLVLVGGGVHISRAYEELRTFCETLGIPVAHTLSGKGSLPCTHPLSIGVFGRWSRVANELIQASDCLVVVGSKLGEISTRRYDLIRPGTPLIHIELVPEEIGRTTPASVALVGDAATSLADLLAAIRADAGRLADSWSSYRAEVLHRLDSWLEAAKPRLESTAVPIGMARVVHELNSAIPADGVLVADGGFAAHWTGLLYDTKAAGRGYVADRGFASIGYGLPGGIGAQEADPRRPVVALTGDGGFNMAIGELETARRMKSGLTIVVINNAASGYVKALQHALFEGRYQSSDLAEVDYSRVAEAFGCAGIRVEDPADLAGAIRSGIDQRTLPTVVDVVVTRDPSAMLPGVDNRVATARKGDRIA